MQQSTLDVQQIPEVRHAVLVYPVLRHQQREHRTPGDGGLEKRARAQSDHRAAVRQRIVIIGLRAGIDRGATLHNDVLDAVEREVDPLFHPFRVRSHQNADLAQARIVRVPQREHPVAHEFRLERRGHRAHRGTDIQHERP